MLIPVLIAIVIVLLIFLFYFFKKAQALEQSLEQLSFDKSSQSVKYGKLTEQWIPFSENTPFDPQNFRFIGSPIDGIAFDNDKIYFCEFKTGSSQLSFKQKRIKELVKNKLIEWFELNIK